MKTPDQTSFAPVALATQAPAAVESSRVLDSLGCRIGLAALLLLCLGGLLLPLRASAQPQPVVTLEDVPGNVLIGENFTFKIRFKNLSTTPGYGPFIDLVLDAGGAAVGPFGAPCDGVTFLSATLLTGGPLALPATPTLAPCPAGPGPTACVPLFTHPFGPSPLLSPIAARLGSQLQTIVLPFAHYEATQPDLVIEVTARVSVLANANVPLTLCVRGGFSNGDSANVVVPPIVSDPSLDSCAWAVCAAVTPTVMKVSKAYLGPEGEAASGPNFSTFYPLQYALTADIATGQTINNLYVSDSLPPTLVQNGNVTVKINGNLAVAGTDYYLTTSPSPFNFFVLYFVHPIIGTAAPDDVVVTFQAYVPEYYGNASPANGIPILEPNCATGITNVLRAGGSWTPVDTRDPGPIFITAGPVTNIITAKCLAVQKSVRHVQAGDYPAAAGYPAAVSGDLPPPMAMA